jgi:peroxiredoxin
MNRPWLIPQRATFVVNKQGTGRRVFVSAWPGLAHMQQAIGMLRPLKAED